MTVSGQTQSVAPGHDRPAARRRGVWPWVVAAVVIAGLAVLAWFVAEHIARDILTRTVREQIITQLALPEDQQIDVSVNEPVLPQVLGGRLERLDVSSDDVELSGVVADVSAHATDVPIRQDAGDIGSAEATITFGEDQLQTLLDGVEGIPDTGLRLTPPTAAFDTELRLFALTVPVGVDLTPSAEGGDIVLTPTAVRVSGAELSADALRRQFGVAGEALLSPREICIADRLPAGLTLRAVSVQSRSLEVEVDIDGAIISDPALQQDGTCA